MGLVRPGLAGTLVRALGSGRDHCAAQLPRVTVVKPGEHELLLLGVERGDHAAFVVGHAFCRACASTVSIVSMMEIVSSSGISALSVSPAASRRATSSA